MTGQPTDRASAAMIAKMRFRRRAARFLLLPVLACAMACSGAGTEDVLTRARASGTLRVALTEANPPWNFLDDADRPAGYDVDVARELAKRLRIGQVEFIGSDYASFIGGVLADRFDIVVSAQTITSRRREQVDFSRPYAVNDVAVFVRTGDTAIVDVGDLAGRRIAVSEGTTEADFARSAIPRANVRTYRNATLGLTDLSQGRADAALVSRFQGGYLATRKALPVRAAIPALHREILGMSFRKGSPHFRDAVDTAINGMIADGTLTAISHRWFGDVDMAAEMRDLPTAKADKAAPTAPATPSPAYRSL
ncbi:transporter substrate-binding domain-containing protein [Microbispora sp. RL4-1S]|uniref:Transporter substrate-binding domain-containing protein n=1 Tax=Microbispora oryzae TaxID=2806554 RepID=A0A940WNA8_9ACTN|nr:transporter substrate-binding domain-containing protein [Microbispora oryzae]MBP2706173.1 transporter substrate-binding domain-containing protein [Microbispora oryzae]